MSRGRFHEVNSGKYFSSKPTKLSNAIPVSASGAIEAISVASGDYVWRIGIIADAVAVAASAAGFSLGDGDRADRYLDDIVSLATNDMIFAPTIKTATLLATQPSVRTDEVGGHRYTANDTIDITVTNSKVGGGSLRVMAWITDSLT